MSSAQPNGDDVQTFVDDCFEDWPQCTIMALDVHGFGRLEHAPPPPFSSPSALPMRKAACSAHALRIDSSSCKASSLWVSREPDMVLVSNWQVRDGRPCILHYRACQLTMDTPHPGPSLTWQSGLQMGLAWVDEVAWTWTRHLSKTLTSAYTWKCDGVPLLQT